MSTVKPTFISANSPIMHMESKSAFDKLTQAEKLYTYYYTRASWEGQKVGFFERSAESPALFYLIYKIVATEGIESLRKKFLAQGNTELEWKQLASYLAAFLNNCANFRSFGDDKFIPEVSREKFTGFIKLSQFYAVNAAHVDSIWGEIIDLIYDYHEPNNHIGFIDSNQRSALYSYNTTKADAQIVDDFLKEINLQPWNQRLIKVSDTEYHILVASGAAGRAHDRTHNVKGKTFKVIYGDFDNIMENTANYLRQVVPYCANDNQRKMTEAYVSHFRDGNIDTHKDSQRFWVKDVNPNVETNIGFIETYVDPFGVRAEFEGWVAIVDKENSKRYATLVNHAEELLKKLPWGSNFEKDKFLRPDFTSLEVISFASSGTPRGINIPNYDDIRQDEGFKNVTLTNAMPLATKETLLFTPAEYLDCLVENDGLGINLKIAFHELLGHGSGKLLQEDATGKLNFDKNIIDPLTGAPVAKWYGPNDSWSSRFGGLNNPYEECRADAVALYLSTFPEVVRVLYPEYDARQQDIVFTEWYTEVLQGVTGLEYYTPEQDKWGQAHNNGAYVIMQVLREAGEGLVNITASKRADGSDYINVALDRSKINTVGQKALGQFLLKLQVYKSTGDVEKGEALFAHYSKVDETFLKFRTIVLANKLPRRLELQGDFLLAYGKDGVLDVNYVQWPETPEGIISSYICHFQNDVNDVLHHWNLHKAHFLHKH